MGSSPITPTITFLLQFLWNGLNRNVRLCSFKCVKLLTVGKTTNRCHEAEGPNMTYVIGAAHECDNSIGSEKDDKVAVVNGMG